MTEQSRQINKRKEYVEQLNKRRGVETEEFQRLVRKAERIMPGLLNGLRLHKRAVT